MDSNDRERVGEAREELMRMLAEDELRDAVLLVFANKQVSVTSCPLGVTSSTLGANNSCAFLYFSLAPPCFSITTSRVHCSTGRLRFGYSLPHCDDVL